MSKSVKQKVALVNQRNKELEGVKGLDPNFYCEGDVGKFISLYLQSEVFAKKLQRYFRTDENIKGKDELNIAALKAAIKRFRLDFDESHVSELFKGGSGKQNEKSARQLRNGYLHSLSVSDKNEILKKAESFVSKLKVFLSLRISAT
ncbi:hypothetical protein Q4602_12815 [Paraglaciecola chathamensis]|uniref:hypothetical protein n=1 Tax=Paraglaciecola chathamensis TaxID=368405 RepID=UPI00270DB382|nr:hypothetical protein [Paraglaciecola chathamensis]MDO6840359.1 hypothetical protein [Paraglaciecola chathamensis]